MNPELMKFIEWLLRRNIHFAVTSAFRTKERNKECNGSKNSQHLTGDAVDLSPLNTSIGNFVLQIKDSPFKFDQLIKYPSFVHISFARGRNPRQMELTFTETK